MFLPIIVIVGLFVSNIEVEAAKKYDYVGCYDTTDKSKLLYQFEKRDEKLSPKSCVDLCTSRQLAYAALVKNLCRCGQNHPPEIIKRSDKDCDHSCPGDKNAKCGGEWKASIYESGLTAQGNDAIPSRIYLGCYKDNDPNYRLLRGSFQESVDNTPTKCHRICYNQGFRYFGLFDRQCLCDDVVPYKHKALPDADCQSYCYEDDSEFCGGNSAMSLYSTGISDVPEYGRYLGCFSNEKFQNIKPEVSMNFNHTNSNRRCLNICDQKGFKYSGVQEGLMCSCTNQEPPTTWREEDYKCDDNKCPGEILEGCGARDVMKVFKTRKLDNIPPTESRYMGCYKDNIQFPTLEGIKEIFETNLTPELCTETCRLRGYAFSGVESGTECYCSHSFPSVFLKVQDGGCNTPCSGSPNEHCGGSQRISVYDTGIPHPQAFVQHAYLGCYKEDEPGVRLLEGISENFPNLSPALCHKHCLQSGFLYYGLSTNSEGIGKCICSDQTPPEKVLTNDDECQKKCRGNPNKMCGSDWRVAVYRTGLSNTESEYVYRGCYENPGIILNDKKSYQTKSLTSKRCYRFCNMLGFKLSGVEEGKICRCGNDFPSRISPKPDESCSVKCPGNVSETCGGHRKHIQVYGIKDESSEDPEKIDNDDANQILFSESFDFMDPALWFHNVKIAHEPNYEFVTYERCHHVIYLREGILYIKPRIQPHAFVEKDSVYTLENCTGKIEECTKKAEKYIILPPIQSGQVSTERSFRFLYGKVDVTARLPVGDWVVPQIWLMPATKEYGEYYQSGQIRIAMTRGNTEYDCSDDHFGYRRLEMGIYLSDHAINLKKKVFYKVVPEDWPNQYHKFSVTWTPDFIQFHVDGEELGIIQPEAGQTIRQIVGIPESDEYIYKNGNKMAPFDKEFYLTLGVSVGGISDFPDSCRSNPKKPWTNKSPKGMLNFWRDKDNWKPTWKDEKYALQVDHVDIRSVENNFV